MVKDDSSMREQVWLPLMRSEGTASLGASILRLASLAEAAHLQQTRDDYQADQASDGRADGSAPRDVAVSRDGRDHTEVDR
jgi:hypothetical protein